MRNKLKSGTSLLQIAINELDSRLPASWSVELIGKSSSHRGCMTGAQLLVRSHDGTISALAVEVKRNLDPRNVPAVLENLGDSKDATPFVISHFLSPRTREQLVAGGAGYADATGNVHLALESPAVFIDASGAESNPLRMQRPLHSLKGPASGRVVRTLCDIKPPFGVLALAARAEAPPSTTSRVVALLEREALITREPRGPIKEVDWPGLIRYWTTYYSLISSNRTATFLESRGLPGLLNKLARTDKLVKPRFRYAVTGSIAVADKALIAPAKLAVVYIDEIDSAAETLELLPVEAGANVILAEPFDPVVFERTFKRDGVTMAAPSQVAADLLTSPGRGPAEAEKLIAWMEKNEDDWRNRGRDYPLR